MFISAKLFINKCFINDYTILEIPEIFTFINAELRDRIILKLLIEKYINFKYIKIISFYCRYLVCALRRGKYNCKAKAMLFDDKTFVVTKVEASKELDITTNFAKANLKIFCKNGYSDILHFGCESTSLIL